MRRPLFFFCFCLVAFAAVRYHCRNIPAGGGPPDGTLLTVTGKIIEKDQTSFVIKIQNAAVLRQDYPTVKSNNRLPDDWQAKMSGEKLLCGYDSARELLLGSKVTLQGDFSAFRNATNPGEFDYALYYHSLGYAGRMENTVLTEKEPGSVSVREWLYRLRCFWEEKLYRIFPEKEASVMTAILLGDKSGVDEEIKKLYQRNGIIHILSISGLHITLIGMGIYKLLRRLGAGPKSASAAGGTVLVLYGVMTGLGVSVCRAIGMYLLRMLAQIMGRTYDMLTALGVMALLMVLYHPAWLDHMGFLLSFGSVVGVGAVLPALTVGTKEESPELRLYVEGRWRQRLLQAGQRFWSGLCQSLWAGFSITITTLPIQLWYAFEIPVYSILLNALVLPLMGVVIAAGLTAMLIPGLGAAALADMAILAGYERLCGLFEKFPHAVWNPGRPDMWQVVVFYLLLAAAAWGTEWMKRRVSKRKKGICSMRMLQLALLSAAVLLLGLCPHRGDRVTFLDVGQGDCICVQLSSGEVYLFDCGSSSRSHVGERVLLPFLKYYGIERVDAVFLSHADEDHINGALELFDVCDREHIAVGQIVLPGIDRALWQEEFGEIWEAAEGVGERRNTIPVTVIRAGESWRAGEDGFVCLHPSLDGTGEGGNAGSECFYIQLCEGDERMSVLLTGDVEGAGEEELLAQLENLDIRDITVYKVAHHGSKNSTSLKLLEQTRPELAVISCGRNNRYGHPHEELLERLKEAGSTIFSTAANGAVEIWFTDKKAQVRVWQGVPPDGTN